MKRILSLILIAAAVIFAGCGKDDLTKNELTIGDTTMALTSVIADADGAYHFDADDADQTFHVYGMMKKSTLGKEYDMAKIYEGEDDFWFGVNGLNGSYIGYYSIRSNDDHISFTSGTWSSELKKGNLVITVKGTLKSGDAFELHIAKPEEEIEAY